MSIITKNLNIRKTIKNYSSETLKNRFLKNKKTKFVIKKLIEKKQQIRLYLTQKTV